MMWDYNLPKKKKTKSTNFSRIQFVNSFGCSDDRSISESLKLFELIHLLTTNHKTITRITKEVVEDFAAENVVYLELRTTPKRNDSEGMSKRSYMEAVVEGLRSVSTVEIDIFRGSDVEESHGNGHSQRKKIYVRLLLSIDRRETREAAMGTVQLAMEMRHLGVVGIDLCGNPMIGEWTTFWPVLEFAREQGLLVTLHCGEVPNMEEINAMLDFLPARIGHACCLKQEEWKKLKSYKIPVEICLTSNIRTEIISSLDIHHFADLYNCKHPIVLCTDDSGVFSTTLSREYAIASSAFGIEKREMFELARNAIGFIFAGDGVKLELEQIFDLAAERLQF
ncbi:unnamed protein product [Cuscuta campestris]|uniref:Adenosine deaminase domain-containing protein n=1 Tax=Cuscuta campestris TaxID=132261 RepID=A0A484MLP2_9ASTE|nr:unnamed protein product [Cuscuta campestris]